MIALIALLGLIMTGFAVDWTIDSFDDDEDDADPVDPDMPQEPTVDPTIDPTPDPDTAMSLEGVADSDEALTGGTENDTLTGNETDSDTLIGGAGDDVLNLHHRNLGTGGEGADTFVMDEDDRFRTFIRIDDFEPGIDTLEILHEVSPGNTALPHITVYEGESTVLYLRDASDPDDQYYSRIGLTGTTGFTLDDLTITFVDTDGNPISTAVPTLSYANVAGTQGDDTSALDDPHTIYQGDMGAGDDTVTSNSAFVTLDLGDGNDSYTGTGQLPDGYIPEATRGYYNFRYSTSDEHIDGGQGNDTITTGHDRASVYGGTGDDVIDASNTRSYTINGGAGNDHITTSDQENGGGAALGGDGNDTLIGGAGNDYLIDHSGADSLDGGAGNDRFLFGSDDTATGGTGADHFYVWTGDEAGTAPRITDFEAENDTMELELAPDIRTISGIEVTYDAVADETNIYADGALSLVLNGDHSGLTIAYTNTPSSDHNLPSDPYFDQDGNAVDLQDVDIPIYLWQRLYG